MTGLLSTSSVVWVPKFVFGLAASTRASASGLKDKLAPGVGVAVAVLVGVGGTPVDVGVLVGGTPVEVGVLVGGSAPPPLITNCGGLAPSLLLKSTPSLDWGIRARQTAPLPDTNGVTSYVSQIPLATEPLSSRAPLVAGLLAQVMPVSDHVVLLQDETGGPLLVGLMTQSRKVAL